MAFGLNRNKSVGKGNVYKVSKVSKPKKYRVRKLINPKGKFCLNCKEWKEYNEFNKESGALSGYNSWCKECYKQYYEDNKEQIRQYKKQHYEDNKEQIKQYNKQYYEENKEQSNIVKIIKNK